MNVNNQPNFGANFKWANKKAPEIVAKRLLSEDSRNLTEAIKKSKTHGGDDITHALDIDLPDVIDPEKTLYDYKGTLTLSNGKKRTIKQYSSESPADFALHAQNAAEAFETVKKHNLSQKKINEFEHPYEIVEYGKQLDLEG